MKNGVYCMSDLDLAIGKKWLKYAHRDFDDAKFTLQGKRYSLSCYLSQQTAVKALKAYLSCKGQEKMDEKTVTGLCDCAKQLNPAFEENKNRWTELDNYLFQTRYPDSVSEGIPAMCFNDADAGKALNIAAEISGFISRALKE